MIDCCGLSRLMIEAVSNDINTTESHGFDKKSYLPGCMTSRLQGLHELISPRTIDQSPIDKGKWREDARVPRAFHDVFAFCRRHCIQAEVVHQSSSPVGVWRGSGTVLLVRDGGLLRLGDDGGATCYISQLFMRRSILSSKAIKILPSRSSHTDFFSHNFTPLSNQSSRTTPYPTPNNNPQHRNHV